MELTTVWFILIAVLWIGYFTLEGFDFGVGMLLPVLGRSDDTERRVLINTIGPVWDGNEVWLLVAGGATFAAFPEWYATLFSGFYLPLLLILRRADRPRPRLRVPRQARRRPPGGAAGTWPSSSARSCRAAVGRRVRQHPARRADRRRPGVRRRLLQPAQPLRAARRAHDAAAVPHPRRDVRRAQDRRRDPRRRPRAGAAPRRSARPSSPWPSWSGPRSMTGTAASAVAFVVAALALVAGLVAVRAGREGWAFLGTFVAIALGVAGLFLALFPDVMPTTLADGVALTTTTPSATDYTLKIMTVVAVIFTPVVLAYQGWTYWVFRKRIAVHHIPDRRRRSPPAVRPTRPLAPPAPGAARGASWPASWSRGVRRQPARDRPGLGRRRPGARRARRRRRSRPPAPGRRWPCWPRRGLAGWLGDVAAARAAASRVGDVAAPPARRAVGRRAARRRLPPASVAVLATRGVTAAEPYLTRYLPALVLAAVLPPLTVVAIATQDLLSARHRAAHAAAGAGVRRPGRPGHPRPGPRAVAGDVLAVWPLPRRRARAAHPGGAPPGRARSPRGSPRSPTATGAPRCGTLRIAFASSVVLELVATLSVALVAVTAGVRLAGGLARPAHRARRPAARARGVLAAAPGRGRVPCRRRGRGDVRGRPRRARGRHRRGQWPTRRAPPGARPASLAT